MEKSNSSYSKVLDTWCCSGFFGEGMFCFYILMIYISFNVFSMSHITLCYICVCRYSRFPQETEAELCHCSVHYKQTLWCSHQRRLFLAELHSCQRGSFGHSVCSPEAHQMGMLHLWWCDSFFTHFHDRNKSEAPFLMVVSWIMNWGAIEALGMF